MRRKLVTGGGFATVITSFIRAVYSAITTEVCFPILVLAGAGANQAGFLTILAFFGDLITVVASLYILPYVVVAALRILAVE